ncbi:hypothetical protein KI387_018562, partial [Taxus chinensis]
MALDPPKKNPGLRHAVRVKDDFSGRILNLWTTALGLQFYSFNMLKMSVEKGVEPRDSLLLGTSLTGNQTIISMNGTFALGFFSPNGTNNWYIGIWFALISDKTVVWVANREIPVRGASGVLNFSIDGRLRLFDLQGRTIWSSDNILKASRALMSESLAESSSILHGTGRFRTLVIVLPSSVAVIVVLVMLTLFIRQTSRRRPDKCADEVPNLLRTFTYKELQIATKNFRHKLGKGAFGSVFKGTLPDNTIVAVKKLKGSGQAEKQFHAEISTIGNIQHVNLVRLRGFCTNGSRRLLVY